MVKWSSDDLKVAKAVGEPKSALRHVIELERYLIVKLRRAEFPDSLATTAFAFRGYDVANLGRTPELLDHPDYGPVMERALLEGSRLCSEVAGRKVDLVGRVRRREETRDLSTYAEDIALIVSASMGQMQLLAERFGARIQGAKLALGYSLGEATALMAAGVFQFPDLLRVPLALAHDCVELSRDVTMGVLFSRGHALDPAEVECLCLEINQEDAGTIGVSTILSPNCTLLLGQRGTVDRFASLMRERLGRGVALRKNPHRWPPLHTQITWQRAVPNRAAVMLQSIPGGMVAPCIPVVSGVTGQASYTSQNSRELLHRWVDHPQRLWDQIVSVLSAGVRTVIHVGPAPNLIPATFKRLAEDVRGQLDGHSPGSLGKRVVSRMVRRQWLAQMLPSTAVLLRAPSVQHIDLENWLLEHAAAAKEAVLVGTTAAPVQVAS
jgi:[acyl-carrier-protein] S-malonyltransferase